MLNRFTRRIIIGESEKVAKKAVEEHKIRGSLRFRRPSARLNAPVIHFKLSIGNYSYRRGKTISVPVNGPERLPANIRNYSSIGKSVPKPTAAFKGLIVNQFACKVTFAFPLLFMQ